MISPLTNYEEVPEVRWGKRLRNGNRDGEMICISAMHILRSPAGYYLGRSMLVFDETSPLGIPMPFSRESQYFPTVEAVLLFFKKSLPEHIKNKDTEYYSPGYIPKREEFTLITVNNGNNNEIYSIQKNEN